MNKSLKKSHRKLIEEIKLNWKLIHIDASECKVIKYDKEIQLNDFNAHRFSFWEKFNSSSIYKPKKTDKISKLICYYNNVHGETKEFVEFLYMDFTVLSFKIKMRDKINIYTLNKSGKDEFYIDLDFLYD